MLGAKSTKSERWWILWLERKGCRERNTETGNSYSEHRQIENRYGNESLISLGGRKHRLASFAGRDLRLGGPVPES